MKPICTLMVSRILPALRVTVARKLIEEYNMRPAEAAMRMTVTPAAVTQYLKGARGKLSFDAFTNKKVEDAISQLVVTITGDPIETDNMLHSLCNVCRTIREEGLLCDLCRESSLAKTQECNFCIK